MLLKAAGLIPSGFVLWAFDVQHNVILIQSQIWVKARLSVILSNFIIKICIGRVCKSARITAVLCLHQPVNHLDILIFVPDEIWYWELYHSWDTHLYQISSEVMILMISSHILLSTKNEYESVVIPLTFLVIQDICVFISQQLGPFGSHSAVVTEWWR